MKSVLWLICIVLFFSTGCVAPQTKIVYEAASRKVDRDVASTSAYTTKGLCGGLPRVTSVKAAPGFCLGLLDSGEGLVKPRYALQIDESRILLTDMGGWNPHKGSIYLLTLKNGAWSRTLLLSLKNTPTDKKCILNGTQQVIIGPGQLVYVTSTECVATLDPKSKDLAQSLKIRLSNLPTDGLHAAKIIVFDAEGNMYMNVGSRTDNCENETSEICQETRGFDGRGVIRKYRPLGNGDYDSQHTIFAEGQRNSLGLHWDEKSQSLWTVENARDYINRVDTRLNGEEHPSDEFNIIRERAVLDWPYCYDAGVASPEFPYTDCTQYQKPFLLFPAHSAPLSLLMYTGKLFPPWYQNRLLISFHGYESYGHRIVTYKRDNDLQPVGEPLSVVYDWDRKPSQKVGSPAGITQALDGSVLIVEDNSQKVLKLFYNEKDGNGSPVAELKVGTAKRNDDELQKEFLRAQKKRQDAFTLKLKQQDVPLFTQIQDKVLNQNCTICHGGMNYPGMQILMYDDIGNYKKLKDHLLARVKGDGVPQMPPSGLPEKTKAELIQLIEKWVSVGSPAP